MIVDGAVVAVLVALFGAAAIATAAARRTEKALAHSPPGIEPHTKAETYYRLCRRMAHELQGIVISDDTLPVLSPEQRKRVDQLLREWEEA